LKKQHRYYYYLIAAIVLALASMLVWYLDGKQTSSRGFEKYTRYIAERVNEEVKISNKELQALQQRMGSLAGKELDFRVLKLKYPLYIFQDGQLKYWSEYRFVPRYATLQEVEDLASVRFPVGKFIVNKKVLDNGYEAYSCIPLSYEYSIENNYITSGLNADLFTHQSGLEISTIQLPTNHAVYSSAGAFLFSIEYKPGASFVSVETLYTIILLAAVSIVLLLLFLFNLVRKLGHTRGITIAGLVLLAGLIGIRAFMLWSDFPHAIYQFKLFDSRYFASSEISPSLGDLLLNVLFFAIFSWFVLHHYVQNYFLKRWVHLKPAGRYILQVLLSAFSILILWYLSFIYTEIYANSQWSLDVSQSIEINLFKLVSLFIIVLAAGIYFIYNHIFIRLYKMLSGRKVQYWPFLSAALLLGLVGYFIEDVPVVLTGVYIVYWGLLLFFDLPRNLMFLKYSTYLYFLLTALVCSYTGAQSLYYVNQEKTILEKHKYAMQLLDDNDLFAEYLLSEAIANIGEDKFIKNRLKSFFTSKELIEQKIQKTLLPDYLDKYEVNISVFDDEGNALLRNTVYRNYYQVQEKYCRPEYSTAYPSVFFLSEPGNSPLKRYMAFREITEQGRVIGSIILELSHKKNSPNSVYPELLVDKKFIMPQQSKNYQYAFYDKKFLLSKGNFNYEKFLSEEVLNQERLYNDGITLQRNHHFGLRSSDGKVVIVSSEEYYLKNILSNFSFLFLLLLFFVLTFVAVYIYYFRYHRIHLNYATKILIYLNIAFFLPLLIVSITTLSMISSNYKDNQSKSYVKKAENISANVTTHMERYIDEPNREARLESDIAQLAHLTDTDINLYNKEGELVYSYHPAIYNRNLLSRYINSEAYRTIVQRGVNEVMLPESVGKLRYNAVYMSIKSYKTGELLGVLSIPFFESRQELNQQIIGVFTTTLNVFSVIFILFLGLSYLASRVLTQPLDIITQKIRKTTLEDTVPLEWEAKDEIGILIAEYNSMLVKLEESRVALSRSEKESAWREMAKQVAHEIKNPLTPMKLKIQHLQRGWRDKNENIEKLTEQGLQSILDQVNILSEIASSFSAFAKMPIPKTEHFDIAAVLKSTVYLYNNTHDVHVDSKVEEGKFIVEGDGQLMGAIFTNLIINAIQSVPFDKKPLVEITLSAHGRQVRVEFKDNGEGVSEEIQEKVFLPNFSTKDTGSGIGLAVAKRGVEHAGGRIWFATQKGIGTTFFIEIPMVH
jgi:two-component system nitrogen regulation sensor histidine kinase NtrY